MVTVTDDTDVTGDGNVTLEDRLGVVEDAIGLAHRRIGSLRYDARVDRVSVTMLAVGLIALAVAVGLVAREVAS